MSEWLIAGQPMAAEQKISYYALILCIMSYAKHRYVSTAQYVSAIEFIFISILNSPSMLLRFAQIF